MLPLRICVPLLAFGALLGSPAAASADLYVAPRGDDTAAGTAARPLRTLGAALDRADGQTVRLAPGSYPQAVDTQARSRRTTVVGAGAGRTRVAGLSVLGGTRLVVSSLTVGPVVISTDPRSLARPARAVTVRDAEITAPGRDCVTVRNGVRRILLLRLNIHDCHSGLVGPAGGRIPQSGDIAMRDTRIRRLQADGVQFGQWDRVQLENNYIAGIADPDGVEHNDAIQLTGNSRNVLVRGNRLEDSRHQLLFVQDAMGPIAGVVAEDNLIVGAGAVAVQFQGATGVKFSHNTVWNARYGGLWLRDGMQHGGRVSSPRDTVVTDNVLMSFTEMENARAALKSANYVAWSKAWGPARVPDPGFRSLATGDYIARGESPIAGLGASGRLASAAGLAGD